MEPNKRKAENDKNKEGEEKRTRTNEDREVEIIENPNIAPQRTLLSSTHLNTTNRNTTIRSEPINNPLKTYMNLNKQQEIIEYFHSNDTDEIRKLIKKQKARITLHTEGLMPSEIAKMGAILNINLENRSRNNRYIHGTMNLRKHNMESKMNLPGKYRHLTEPKEIMTHMDFTQTVEQSTQTNDTEPVNNTQTNATTIEPRIIIEPLLINNEILPTTIDFPPNTLFNTATFINYTQIPIPANIAYILGLGPKAAIPLNADTDEELYQKIERTTLDLYEEHTEILDIVSLYERIKNIIESHKKHGKQTHNEIREFYEKSLEATLQFMRDNKQVIASQTDKSKAAVLIYKKDYIERMKHHLSDETVYQKTPNSSVEGYKIINERFLHTLQQRGYINIKTKEKALKEENKISNIYGLIKDHKPNQKIRPICNTRKTPGYTIAKTLNEILTKALKPSLYDVKNSTELKGILEDEIVTPTMTLASFDVISMFTNIDFESVKNAVTRRYEKNTINTRLPMKIMIDMLRFICQHNTEIRFDSNIYKQIKGLRMGSPVSPILARMVMDDLIEETFKNIEKPNLFVKYVDDILTIDRPENIDKILAALNQQNPNIQFEAELEDPNKKSINYLELTIFNNHDTTIETRWFQKQISSKRLLNFHSQHAKFQIEATAKNYINNMIKLTDEKHKETVKQWAREILKINNYPTRFINNIIKDACKTTTNTQTCTQSNTQNNTQSNHQTHNQPETTQETNTQTTNTQLTQTYRAHKAMPYVRGLSNHLLQSLRTSNPEMTIPSSTINTIQGRIYNKYKNLNKKGKEQEELN